MFFRYITLLGSEKLCFQVKYLDEYFFLPDNKTFPGKICIGVTDTGNPLEAPQLGWLKAISPEEPRHALLRALARDIRNGEEHLDNWRTLTLSVEVEFVLIETDDKATWEPYAIREQIGALFEAVYPSAAHPSGSNWCFTLNTCLPTPGPARVPNRSLQGQEGGPVGDQAHERQHVEGVESQCEDFVR